MTTLDEQIENLEEDLKAINDQNKYADYIFLFDNYFFYDSYIDDKNLFFKNINKETRRKHNFLQIIDRLVLIFIKIFKIIKKNLRKIHLPNRLLDFYLV